MNKYRARVRHTIVYELEFDATSKIHANDVIWDALEDLEMDSSTSRAKVVDQHVIGSGIDEVWEMEPGAVDE